MNHKDTLPVTVHVTNSA